MPWKKGAVMSVTLSLVMKKSLVSGFLILNALTICVRIGSGLLPIEALMVEPC